MVPVVPIALHKVRDASARLLPNLGALSFRSGCGVVLIAELVQHLALSALFCMASAKSRACSMPPLLGVSTSSAPKAFMVWARSIDKSSGITSTMR